MLSCLQNFHYSVWLQLLDRNQQNLDLVLIPLSFFRPCSTSHGLENRSSSSSDISLKYPQILCSIHNHNWINVFSNLFLLFYILPINMMSTFLMNPRNRFTIFYIFYQRVNHRQCSSFLQRKKRDIVISICTLSVWPLRHLINL